MPVSHVHAEKRGYLRGCLRGYLRGQIHAQMCGRCQARILCND